MRSAARFGYVLFSWLFVVGVLVQVFLVGLVVVAGQITWDAHTDLGHGLGIPLILMLILMYLGRLSPDIKRITWVLFGVYLFQADFVIFLRDSVPVAAALHPVLALIDFSLGWLLARRATASLQDTEPAVEAASAPGDPLAG
ncbi:MAG: DUF6220 domain-containing protein [Anaerolineales bacterium]